MGSPSQSTETILRFVRGELDYSAVQVFGVRFAFDEKGMLRAHGKETATTAPSLRDFSLGFLRLNGQPDRLRPWAAILLSATVVDLESLQDNETGEMFLESLWDAAFSDTVGEKTLAAARNLVGTTKL
jgi:hypothetical protein